MSKIYKKNHFLGISLSMVGLGIWSVITLFTLFNRHSICIAPCFAIFQCIFIVCLNDSLLHSYPKSRDAIASKKLYGRPKYFGKLLDVCMGGKLLNLPLMMNNHKVYFQLSHLNLSKSVSYNNTVYIFSYGTYN